MDRRHGMRCLAHDMFFSWLLSVSVLSSRYPKPWFKIPKCFCLEPGVFYKHRAVAFLPHDIEAVLGSTRPPEEIDWLWRIHNPASLGQDVRHIGCFVEWLKMEGDKQ